MAANSPLPTTTLSNNYELDAANRGELEAFAEIARGLPPKHVKVALILQATSLQNHQLLTELKTLCITTQESLEALRKSTSENVKVSKEQNAELTPACKKNIFRGQAPGVRQRNHEAGDTVLLICRKAHLKKYMNTNGLAVFFQDNTQATTKLLNNHLGRAVSGVKSFMRRTFIQSLSDGDSNHGCSVTALTAVLAKKCLGGSENAKPKHAIWCLIVLNTSLFQQSFIRHDAQLRMSPAASPKGDDNDDDDDNDEFTNAANATPAIPIKRTHSGTVKAQTSDGRLIAAFWARVQEIFTLQTKSCGTDLKSEKWTEYINTCVAEERVAYPGDLLALIVGDTATAAPVAASSSRLSGLGQSNDVSGPPAPIDTNTESRPALAPCAHNGAPTFSYGASGSSFDRLMFTPTPFVGSSSTNVRLLSLNMGFGGGNSGRY
ncbi:hypothetical protein B0H16DRAFT_1461478 [Mycena metata]|uniref:Uncharacterized protein n=1 Tax=Mycena metata TaxID=1033252 RepID=A0AAD7ISU9_9AGAR|nr:hypothetical protein B0H16DRAFT_1461478 [Mycena metata]